MSPILATVPVSTLGSILNDLLKRLLEMSIEIRRGVCEDFWKDSELNIAKIHNEIHLQDSY